MGFTIGGAVDGMKNMLKNNTIIKKKILHFNDKSKPKYKSSKLTFKKGTKEEIEAFHLKIRKQKRFRILKNLVILLISIALVLLILFYIQSNIN